MNVTLPIIAALLLVLPGIGFIVGVNLADKNVREIVFRNAPAEIGYVIIVSLVAHLIFALSFKSFNVAYILISDQQLTPSPSGVTFPVDDDKPRELLVYSLLYFLASTVTAFAVGFLFGRAIRYFKLSFFTKHRWMLDLVGIRAGEFVYARVLLSPQFPGDGKPGTRAIAVEGFLSDSFFAADGSLLYLVFRNFRETTVRLSAAPYVAKFVQDIDTLEKDGARISPSGPLRWLLRPMLHIPFLTRLLEPEEQVDHLVIEGRWVELARYFPLPGGKLRGRLEELERRVEEDSEALESVGS